MSLEMMLEKFREVDAYTTVHVNDTQCMKAVCIVKFAQVLVELVLLCREV